MLANLREAFRERTRGGACQHALTEAEFWVHDPPRREGMAAEPCKWHPTPLHPVYDLQVINPNGRLLYLILTDKCLYLDVNDPENEPSRCDCAVLLPEERAYFVEFKRPQPGREVMGGGDDRYLRATECLDQLESTIKEFARHGIITPTTIVLAHACVGHTRQRPYPGANYQEMAESFRRRFEGLNLKIKLIPQNQLEVPARNAF
jgi:hypothetical protein